ncbi:MAG: TlpA family protein disulfide reductase [Pirellulales bacterium]|nr:TlpA family protein disulfide reductase [Pirellulales bacterium]
MVDKYSVLFSMIACLLLVMHSNPPIASSEEAPAQTPARTPAIPIVQLSQGHAALCRVGVGDKMPTPSLPDLAGPKKDLATCFGPKATIVVFWEGDRPMTRTLLADLVPDVVRPYQTKGCTVLGIAVRQDAAATQKQLDDAQATFPVLLDTDGAAFALVGSKALPRIYVLDAEGRIVWFDIEYSRATRRELRQILDAMSQ